MSFSIKFTGSHSTNEELGEIALDDFNETIVIPTEYWSKEKYEHQWKEAITRIVSSDDDISSMLMVSMYDPQKANFLVAWPLYKIGSSVYVQNNLIFMNTLRRPFNEQRIYDFVPQRETISEDTGEPISEWQLSLDDLKTWLSK